jgi:putative DNA primase/helicase
MKAVATAPYVWARDKLNIAEHAVQRELIQLSDEVAARAGGCPDKDTRKKMLAFARSLLTRAALTKALAGIQAHPLTTARLEDFDRDPYALNTPRGIVNLRTGKLSPPDPAAMCAKATQVAPADGEPTRFIEVLSDAVEGDADVLDFMQRLFGYGLTGLNGEKLMFVVYGPPHTSKSVIFDVVARVMGDYHTTVPDGELFASKSDRHPTGLQFVTARLATSGEIRPRAAWRGELVKKITGGDQIALRGMRQDFATVAPTAKLILHGNTLPSTDGADPALVDRLVLIPFRHQIPAALRVRNLADQLVRDEGPQILAWMIQGAARYLSEGLTPLPPILEEERATFANAEDLLSRFVAERCELTETGETASRDLFEAWRQWCNANGYREQAQETVHRFGRMILERADELGIKRRQLSTGNRPIGYRGIALQSEWP